MTSKLLILIPAYNEEARIGPTLENFGAYFQRRFGDRCRIVVVLNGCRDGTLTVVQRVAKAYPSIAWTVFEAPIGKGGAIIEGLKLYTQAEYIGFVDADGSTGPESFGSLVDRCIAGHADCVVGSRRLPESIISQSQPNNRLLASKVFHLIVAALFQMGIRDTQCGAKVMTAEAVRRIHNSLHIADMAFDINLLYCLKREKLKTIEAPVEWTDHLGSTVRYFRTSLVMFLSVIRLRLIHSPFRFLFRWFRPVETRIYLYLRNPPPRAEPTAGVPTVHQIGDERAQDRDPEDPKTKIQSPKKAPPTEIRPQKKGGRARG